MSLERSRAKLSESLRAKALRPEQSSELSIPGKALKRRNWDYKVMVYVLQHPNRRFRQNKSNLLLFSVAVFFEG